MSVDILVAVADVHTVQMAERHIATATATTTTAAATAAIAAAAATTATDRSPARRLRRRRRRRRPSCCRERGRRARQVFEVRPQLRFSEARKGAR